MDHDVAGALFDHWAVEPPVEVLVAAFVGYKQSEARTRATQPTVAQRAPVKLVAERLSDDLAALRGGRKTGGLGAR